MSGATSSRSGSSSSAPISRTMCVQIEAGIIFPEHDLRASKRHRLRERCRLGAVLSRRKCGSS